MKKSPVNFQPIADFGKSVYRFAKTVTIISGLLAIGFCGGSLYHTHINLPVLIQVASAAEDEAQQMQLRKMENATEDTIRPAHKPRIPMPPAPVR